MPGKRKRVGKRVCKDFESEDQKVAAAFARLVELGSSTCGAACLVGDTVYVSNNHIHENSRESNKITAIQALMEFLGVKKNYDIEPNFSKFEGRSADDDDPDAKECLDITKDNSAPEDHEGEKKGTSELGDDHDIGDPHAEDEADQDLEEFLDPAEYVK